MASWQCTERFAELKTPWLTLIGEKWLNDRQQTLDYWRVEKADSLIILPQQGDRLLMPPSMFRPGLGETTWDFPGGRLLDRQQLGETIYQILQRELALPATAIVETRALNTDGWPVNSSFSNQKLYGVWVTIDPNYELDPTAIGATFRIPQDFPVFLQRLTCLQCRAVFWEWQHQAL